MPEQIEVTLENLGGGGAMEMFQEEFRKVIENILDVNTKATAPREINLKVKITPTDERRMGATAVTVSSKCAPLRTLSTTLFFGQRGNRVVAVESNPNQMKLDLGFPAEVNIQTGELKEFNKE